MAEIPDFVEERFPTDVSYGTLFGPEYMTDVVVLSSGYEQRNIDWSESRARGDAHYGVKTIDQLQAVISFFHARRGRAQGFRWKDILDFKADHEDVAVGDGTTAVYQLIKVYGTGATASVRSIIKPVGVDYPVGQATDTVEIYIDDVLQTGGYTVNYTTGKVTLGGNLGMGSILSWSGEFDVPCRFDIDHLPASLTLFEVGQISSIPILELKKLWS